MDPVTSMLLETFLDQHENKEAVAEYRRVDAKAREVQDAMMAHIDRASAMLENGQPIGQEQATEYQDTYAVFRTIAEARHVAWHGIIGGSPDHDEDDAGADQFSIELMAGLMGIVDQSN